jgi:predicted AAA+ superfamily ATPase
MSSIARRLAPQLQKAARAFPALLVTGPRRAGKTTLLRQTFPHASYHLLEDPDIIARVRADPRAFLDELELPALLDEIQNTPEILNYIRSRVDRSPRRHGQWLLTGSQEAPLMQGITESMAGRAGVFQLLPLSLEETPKVSVLNGGFPEALARPSARALWYQSYIQTYLERDVRAVSSIRDLATFRRFVALVASRTGQILNKTDLAAPLGVSVPTITQWLSILEISGQILVIAPYFENFGKRLVKSPKIYWVDSGLVCHLLGIETERELRRSPFCGAIFEGFVASEIAKQQSNAGLRRQLYYFRDQQGLEVDFLVPLRGAGLALIEAKASSTVLPAAADPLVRLNRSDGARKAQLIVVYQPGKNDPGLTTLRPNVKAMGVSQLLGHFARSR